MGIFDFMRPSPVEVKESATGSIISTPGQAKWSDWDNRKAAFEGYQQNVVVASAINTIADAVASVDLQVWRGDTQLSSHPLLDLFEQPNPSQSYPEFMRAKIGFHLIAGNSYDERLEVGGVPKELYTLRPDRMSIIMGDGAFPARYVYDVNGKKVYWDVDQATGESDLRHMLAFNPLDDWYGQSPMRAGGYAIDQHNESMAWMQALLQNSARPSGALVSTADTAMPDEQFNRLKAQMEDQYQGSQNAGRPMLLEGGLNWVQMGLSPSDMGTVDTKNSAARDICLAYGVPPMLLGIPGDNTYANYKEARLALWEDTVIPLLDYILAEWSNWLGDGEVIIKADLEKVPAIVDKRMTLWDMADASTDLTINERRALKGYEPISGGDTIAQPSNEVADDESKGLDTETLMRLAYGTD